MNTYLAFPNLYGCELQIFDEDKFRQDYYNQATVNDTLVLMEPGPEHLTEWAKSCLSIDEFKYMHRHGGWSPFRSGQVRVIRWSDEEETFSYKFGDDGEWDFSCTIDAGSVSIQPWLRTVRLFTSLALNLYVARLENSQSIPRLVLQRMLHIEWGECDEKFAYVLQQKGFHPRMLDDMVSKSWEMMLKLPVPEVFAYVHDDDVELKILDMTYNSSMKPV